MKLVKASIALDTLLADFAARFPKLATRNGSFGKCKFMSYELALYLRRRGVKARVIHVQGITRECPWKKTAHATWVDKPRAEWSHYVVAAAGVYIDMTGRQFDRQAEHPKAYSRQQLMSHWQSMEDDTFINGLVAEVLRAQTDANRSQKAQPVRTTTLSPPNQQQVRAS